MHSLAYINDHPFRDNSRHVNEKQHEAINGYAVVRGKNPIACGKKGDILCFAKEAEDSKRIIQMSIAVVDGKRVMPNKWYNVELQESEAISND